jgi:hypothetical protein
MHIRQKTLLIVSGAKILILYFSWIKITKSSNYIFLKIKIILPNQPEISFKIKIILPNQPKNFLQTKN